MEERKAPRPLAVVTGASSGVGYNLARLAVEHDHDLVVAADTALGTAVSDFEALGASVQSVETDLATSHGVEQLCHAIAHRDVDVLMANAGHGLGGAFLDQDLKQMLRVINSSVTGTVHLVQYVGRKMRARGAGRMLITGSLAGLQPGSFEAVYAGTKAFIDSFSLALREELKGSGITVTCLMPGPADFEFFVRAEPVDTRVGQMEQMDAAKVARIGFDAMLKGEADAVAGWMNKARAVASSAAPAEAVAEMHGKLTEPGSAKHG